MNLKLAKRIRQGMREMAQVSHGGALRGIWPEDYEGIVPKRPMRRFTAIFHHDYIHTRAGGIWATEQTQEDGTTTLQPMRLVVSLKPMSARQVYKRAKRMVAR